MLLFIVSFALLLAVAYAACPSGFTQDDTSGKCLQYYTTPSRFEDAENSCESVGGHLVSVQNAFQNNALLGGAKTNFGFSNYWIGAYYNVSQWIWTDGTPFSFNRWGARQPDTIYQCAMVLSSSGGTWTTTSCYVALPYICSYNGNPQTTAGSITKTTMKVIPTTSTSPSVTTKPAISLFCEPGWSLFQQTKYCYKRYYNATFDDANAICQGAGAHLASIHSNDENSFVFGLTRGVYSSMIGLHRATHTSAWTWTDESTLDYLNWDPTAPDYKNLQANCVELFSDKVPNAAYISKWGNIECGYTTNEFTCKKHATTTPPVSPATPSSGPCDSDWSYFYKTRYCYKTYMLAGDFDDAEATCARAGSHLVSIHSDAENSFVYNMTRNVEQTYIGLRRASQRSDWTWTDGSAVNYVNWDAAAPNQKDLSANCVVMYSDGDSWSSYIQEWSNVHCDVTPEEFVCKKIGRF